MALNSPPSKHTQRMLQLLIEKNKISKEQAARIWKDSQGDAVQAEQIAGEMKVPETDVTAAKAEALGVPFVDLHTSKPSEDSKNLIDGEMQDRLKAIPLFQDGDTLVVAMEDPKNFHAIEDLRIKTGHKIRGVLSPPSQVEAFKNGTNGFAKVVPNEAEDKAPELNLDTDGSWSGNDASIDEMLQDLKPVQKLANLDAKNSNKNKRTAEDTDRSDNEDVSEIDTSTIAGDNEAAEEAPIIRIVNTILLYAIKEGASDIHIEPQAKGVRVRYRIDGVLHEQMKIPQYVLNPLISRVKIMSEMNIAERRIPQDGRIKITMQGKEFDMRVNTCPSVFGEKIVMRILDKSSVMLGLDKIGLYEDMQAMLLDIAMQPNGMLIVCGPTGSGKTTTLYSLLNVVSSVEKNVSTVEDPVEYQLPGLTQVQVNRKAGLTFATALRAFLRQDPDVIMVGEIRDLGDRRNCGSGVFDRSLGFKHDSHQRCAFERDTFGRHGRRTVLDFGVDVGSVGATFGAQHLQAIAKKQYEPPRETLLRFRIRSAQASRSEVLTVGRGCDVCKQTGYKGRTGVYELMQINEELQELIVRRAPVTEVKEAARANGMMTLQEDGFRKCKDGHTTVEESHARRVYRRTLGKDKG